MDVSVIIVNYNTLELTQACIDSVFENTKGIEFEVILVDNASTDGSKEYFEKDKRITYIYNEENLGFGRANNLGYSQAKGDYLFLLNSDTYLLNNAIYLLWNDIKQENEKNGNVACAGTMLLDKDEEIAHSYARFPSMGKSILGVSLYVVLWRLHVLKSLPSTNNYHYDEYRAHKIFDVDYITGADLMVKKDVADKFGLFDPDFFMYCEETEMEYRYMRRGLRRLIVQGPRIVHLEGKSYTSHSLKKTTMIMRSHFLYFKKTSGRMAFLIYKIIYKIVYITTYLLCFPFVHGKNNEKWEHMVSVLEMK